MLDVSLCNLHYLRFYRKASNRSIMHAECSCGWSCEGIADEVYKIAAYHDREPKK